MKVRITIFFLLYFNNVFCDYSYFQSAKVIGHRYPKKVPRKNVQILISKRFVKPLSAKPKEIFTVNKGYTAFPAIASDEKKIYEVPDSPYFPLDVNNEQRTRVKKVLPDFIIGPVRKKRSVDLVTTTVNQDVTVKKLKSNRNNTSIKKKGKKSKKKGDTSKTNSTNQKRKHKKRKVSKNTKRENLRNKKRNKLKSGKSKRAKRLNGTKSKVQEKEKASRRLIAAKDALIEDYPYVVSIQKNDEHWCAGALLNPRLVITTANCVWKSNRVSRLRVRAGSRHSSRGGQVANIQEVMKHPEWSIRNNPDNDVALLLLDRRIKFSDSVHGVDLPNRVMLPAFEDAWVTSWGSDRRDGVVDKKTMSLQSFHTRLMDRAKCNMVTQRFGVTVTDNFICLSQLGRRAPCTRDTGAPAVSDGVLWGLASWGIRKLCGTQRFPAMFSYLASQSIMDFITNATTYLMADERHYPYPDRFPTVRVQVTPPTTPGLPF